MTPKRKHVRNDTLRRKDGQPKKRVVHRSPELTDRVLAFIAHGGAVSRVHETKYVAEVLEEDPNVESPAMPTQFAVWDWVRRDEEFAKLYREAKQMAMEIMADEIIAIADKGENDCIVHKNGTVSTNWEAVGRSKLKVEVRLKMMAMLAPKRFNPTVKAELSGTDGGPIRLIIEE